MMIKPKRAAHNIRSLSLAIGVALLAGQSVSADEADRQIQEIVVTAQKRVENAKDVPASISEISSADLEARHIGDYDDLTRSVPSVSFE